jgi:hypothetical protein
MCLIPYQRTPTVYKTDTVYNTKVDTIHDTTKIVKVKPKIKVIERLKTDTVYDDKGNQFELITEQKKYQDTLVCNTDTAIVNATVTGIQASLDTISLELRKSHYIQTNTIEINKYIKPKRFYISPQIGLGYGLTNKSFDMYIGIGIGIRL